MDFALEGDAPSLYWGFGEAQRFKRDRKPGYPTLLVDLSAGVPNRIEAEVFIVVGRQAIPLQSQRVYHKLVSAAVIVEAVNPDINKVIVPNIVTMTQMSTNLARLLIKTDEHGVEVLIVIAQIGDSSLTYRVAIVRDPLPESFDACHFAGHARARLHGHEVLERRWLLHPRDVRRTI